MVCCRVRSHFAGPAAGFGTVASRVVSSRLCGNSVFREQIVGARHRPIRRTTGKVWSTTDDESLPICPPEVVASDAVRHLTPPAGFSGSRWSGILVALRVMAMLIWCGSVYVAVLELSAYPHLPIAGWRIVLGYGLLPLSVGVAITHRLVLGSEQAARSSSMISVGVIGAEMIGWTVLGIASWPSPI